MDRARGTHAERLPPLRPHDVPTPGADPLLPGIATAKKKSHRLGRDLLQDGSHLRWCDGASECGSVVRNRKTTKRTKIQKRPHDSSPTLTKQENPCGQENARLERNWTMNGIRHSGDSIRGLAQAVHDGLLKSAEAPSIRVPECSIGRYSDQRVPSSSGSAQPRMALRETSSPRVLPGLRSPAGDEMTLIATFA